MVDGALPSLWGLKLEDLFTVVGNLQAAKKGFSFCHFGASMRRFKDVLGHIGNASFHGSQVGLGLRFWGNNGGLSSVSGEHGALSFFPWAHGLSPELFI